MSTAPHDKWILLKCCFADKGLNRAIVRWDGGDVFRGDYGYFRWEQYDGEVIAEEAAVGWMPLP